MTRKENESECVVTAGVGGFGEGDAGTGRQAGAAGDGQTRLNGEKALVQLVAGGGGGDGENGEGFAAGEGGGDIVAYHVAVGGVCQPCYIHGRSGRPGGTAVEGGGETDL